MAIAALQVLLEEDLSANADKMGRLFRDRLKELRSPHIGSVRGKGLLNAIVMTHADPEAAWKLCMKLKDNGLLAKPTHGDKIRFAPPLVITEAGIEESIGIIRDSLSVLDEDPS